MRTLIKNKIYLKPKDNNEKRIIKEILKEKLTFVDPTAQNGYSVFTTTIKCYKYTKKDNLFTIPRGRIDILPLILNSGVENEGIKNETNEGLDIDMVAKFDFRDQIQTNAFNSFITSKYNMGILNLGCGIGKSFVAMKIIEHVKKKTLILVDEIYLTEQWNEYFTDWTNLENGEDYIIIHGLSKKKELEKIKDVKVIIASKDSLIGKDKLMEEINQDIGLLIIDECHVASAKVFTDVAQAFDCKHILGLSASIDRDDGMTFLVENTVGPVLIKATIFDSVALGSSILPSLRTLFLKKRNSYHFKKNESYHKVAETVLNDPAVINFVSYIVMQHYFRGDSQLLITQKVAESKAFKDYLVKVGIPENEIAVILGETKMKERKELIEKAKTGEIKVVITSKILDKGISCNRLNVLHNLYPSKAIAVNIQRAGRISRVTPEKTKAVVYDYIYDHPIFMYQFYNKKKKVYRLLAWLQCTAVPDYTKNLLEYIKAYFDGRSLRPYQLGELEGNLDQVVIDIDDFPMFEDESGG